MQLRYATLFVALVALSACHQAPKLAKDETITMSDKMVVDPGKADPNRDDLVWITGTLTGDGIGYRNNTLTAHCSKKENRCEVATLDQIGTNHIGPIDIGDWEISSWTPDVITAQMDGLCQQTKLTIVRASEHIDWTSTPQDGNQPLCTKADKEERHWTVEGSLYWEREHKRLASSSS